MQDLESPWGNAADEVETRGADIVTDINDNEGRNARFLDKYFR